ncbi:MAG: pyrroline-5-carboxylate reductase [Clostridiales bacterium]|nr:pyrroline-5-carboxylate reductase [Clostridiales bacterium]
MKTGFIGVGNMGGAILKGLLEKNSASDALAFDKDAEKLNMIKEWKGVSICGSINELVGKADFVVLGVKPDAFESILPEIAKSFSSGKVLVSMAAGIEMTYIERHLGASAKIIRIMPNTPAMVREAVTAVCGNGNVSEEDMKAALDMFGSIGKAYVVTEELMHCVVGVSGSSPAYTYMYIDSLAKAAVKNGMEKEQAVSFAAQAVLGAAKMVLEAGESPEKLRANVCSPGGTTIEAVRELQERKFEETIEAGFQAAADKSKAMTKS